MDGKIVDFFIFGEMFFFCHVAKLAYSLSFPTIPNVMCFIVDKNTYPWTYLLKANEQRFSDKTDFQREGKFKFTVYCAISDQILTKSLKIKIS